MKKKIESYIVLIKAKFWRFQIYFERLEYYI